MLVTFMLRSASLAHYVSRCIFIFVSHFRAHGFSTQTVEELAALGGGLRKKAFFFLFLFVVEETFQEKSVS